MPNFLNFRNFNLVSTASIFILAVFALSGCSSTVTSTEQNYPLTSVYSAIEKALSMGVLSYSENHRDIISRPFLVKQDPSVIKSGLRDRGLAKVTVYGESRPYTFDVQVSIERSTAKKPQSELRDSDYSFDHYDKRLATRLLNSITSILEKREKSNNFIDDFRSF